MNKGLDKRLSLIEKSLATVEQRNRRVELDKAWETSFVRRVIIAVLTYLILVIVMKLAGAARPWVNAIIPTLGFILSTLSLSLVKQIWVKSRK